MMMMMMTKRLLVEGWSHRPGGGIQFGVVGRHLACRGF